jgi:hypothetical protein
MEKTKRICYQCSIDGKRFYGDIEAQESVVKLRAIQHVIIKHNKKDNPERFVRKC